MKKTLTESMRETLNKLNESTDPNNLKAMLENPGPASKDYVLATDMDNSAAWIIDRSSIKLFVELLQYEPEEFESLVTYCKRDPVLKQLTGEFDTYLEYLLEYREDDSVSYTIGASDGWSPSQYMAEFYNVSDLEIEYLKSMGVGYISTAKISNIIESIRAYHADDEEDL